MFGFVFGGVWFALGRLGCVWLKPRNTTTMVGGGEGWWFFIYFMVVIWLIRIGFG